jgi:hypothetical protein
MDIRLFALKSQYFFFFLQLFYKVSVVAQTEIQFISQNCAW